MGDIKKVNSDTWCLLDGEGAIVLIYGLPQMFCTKEEAEEQRDWLREKEGLEFAVGKVRFG